MLKLKVLFLTFIIFLGGISGCGYTVTLPEGTNITKNSTITNQDIVEKVKNATTNMSQEDKLIVKKMCLGYSSFIQSSLPETTVDALKALQNVQIMYGWDDKKKEINKNYGDALESILGDKKFTNNIDYTKPQKISDVRDNLKMIFESIAEGV